MRLQEEFAMDSPCRPEGIEVELHDLFAEAYGPINELMRRSYLGLVNFAPRAWGSVLPLARSKERFR